MLYLTNQNQNSQIKQNHWGHTSPTLPWRVIILIIKVTTVTNKSPSYAYREPEAGNAKH